MMNCWFGLGCWCSLFVGVSILSEYCSVCGMGRGVVGRKWDGLYVWFGRRDWMEGITLNCWRVRCGSER